MKNNVWIKKAKIVNSFNKFFLTIFFLCSLFVGLFFLLTLGSCNVFNFGEDGTWTVYLYMCGSNLESGNNSGLNPENEKTIAKQALNYNKELYQQKYNWIQKYNKLVSQNNKTLPGFCNENMYNPNRVDWNKTMQNSTESDTAETYSNASRVLEEISTVKLPENVRFVVQTGGSKFWRNPTINPNLSQRFVIDSNGIREISSDKMKNMADGKTFSEFLNFGKINYPADHNICILWNHGLGINGCCSDELYGNDLLTLNEMQQSFAENYPNMEQNKPFDILFFDCCLMGSQEVAYKLKNAANYMVASKENIFEISGYYEDWVNKLAHNTKITPQDLSREICNSYLEHSKKSSSRKNTMAAINLDKIDELKQSYEDLCLKLLTDSCQDNTILKQLKNQMSDIFKFGGTKKDLVNMIDLRTFVWLLPDAYDIYVDKVNKALDNCSVYSKSLGESVSDSPLSFYFPCSISNQDSYFYALNYLESIEQGQASSSFITYYIFGCLTTDQKDYVKKTSGIDVPVTNDYFAF